MARVLSIRQPWAWAILHAGKDIENRSWRTPYRGRILIHAGKAFDGAKWEAFDDACAWGDAAGIGHPSIDDLHLGGIVGEAEIVDCVSQSNSKWFYGPFGFVLRNAKPLPFRPLKGQLGLFEIEES